MFDQVGAIEYPGDKANEEEMLEAAIEAGADDVDSSEDLHVIYCAADQLAEVAGKLEQSNGEPQSAKLIWKPQNLIPVVGDQAESVMKLMDVLDELDDVQNLYANFDISDEEMAKIPE